MVTFIQPLDLQQSLVATLAGSWNTFLLIGLVAVALLSARFRMNNITFFMFIALFAVFMAYWIPWFYAFVLAITGFALYFVISRIIKN